MLRNLNGRGKSEGRHRHFSTIYSSPREEGGMRRDRCKERKMGRVEKEGNGGTPLEARKRRGRKRGRAGANHGKKTSLRPEHGVVESPIGGRCRSNTARVVSMETECSRWERKRGTPGVEGRRGG